MRCGPIYAERADVLEDLLSRTSEEFRLFQGLLPRSMADWRSGGSAMAFLGRRQFMSLIGGAAAWPVVARAQGEQLRLVGLLDRDDQSAASRVLRGRFGNGSRSLVGSKVAT
jgi:hypothetical protein